MPRPVLMKQSRPAIAILSLEVNHLALLIKIGECMTSKIDLVDKRNIKLLSRKEAAKYLGISAQTLAVWACSNRYSLPFSKIGRLVKYSLDDLNAFIQNNLQTN
jgi:excisionase family DNA binding protein